MHQFLHTRPERVDNEQNSNIYRRPILPQTQTEILHTLLRSHQRPHQVFSPADNSVYYTKNKVKLSHEMTFEVSTVWRGGDDQNVLKFS